MTAYQKRISDWSSDVCSSDLCHERVRLIKGKGKTNEVDAQKAAAKLSLPSAHGIFSPHPPGQHQHQRKNEGAGHAEEPKQEVGDPCPRCTHHIGDAATRHRVHRWIGRLIAQQRQRKEQCGQEEQRSEEHTSELQSLMRISYAVCCL